jgi:glycosyltransferase involved in cell wall biosynthesis
VNIAFYAPLKAPDHPVPSGDRAVGRMLLSALRAGGHHVELASRLRSLDRRGDADNQIRIEKRARRVIQRLLERYRRDDRAQRPQLWFTYHLYHKAPDLIGPIVSRELNVPYVVAEASHAPRQAAGAWSSGYLRAAAAMQQAAMIITLNPTDEPCVRDLLGSSATLRRIAPFIDSTAGTRALEAQEACAALRQRLGMRADRPTIACVAMMRHGDKLASYRILSEALSHLVHLPWQLLLLGDGPASEQVEALMRPLSTRVFRAGLVAPQMLPQWLCGCDLYVWPAVNEAWSMALLEAAAVGVPAIAGDEGGVSSVIDSGVSGIVTPARDVPALARAIEALLGDERRRRKLGEGARAKVLSAHDFAGASRSLNTLLDELVP